MVGFIGTFGLLLTTGSFSCLGGVISGGLLIRTLGVSFPVGVAEHTGEACLSIGFSNCLSNTAGLGDLDTLCLNRVAPSLWWGLGVLEALIRTGRVLGFKVVSGVTPPFGKVTAWSSGIVWGTGEAEVSGWLTTVLISRLAGLGDLLKLF